MIDNMKNDDTRPAKALEVLEVLDREKAVETK